MLANQPRTPFLSLAGEGEGEGRSISRKKVRGRSSVHRFGKYQEIFHIADLQRYVQYVSILVGAVESSEVKEFFGGFVLMVRENGFCCCWPVCMVREDVFCC